MITPMIEKLFFYPDSELRRRIYHFKHITKSVSRSRAIIALIQKGLQAYDREADEAITADSLH